MTDQDRLEDLLDRWEESRGHGQELSASELCHDYPELAEELVAQIRLLKRSDWMLEVQHEADLDFLPLPPIESLSAHALVPESLSLDQFTTNITTSGVMTGDELSRFDASDAQDLAAHLLRSKQLTKHQAKLIAEGDTDGLVLGNYVILNKIGAGGMGQVFKARHRRMDRIVALKVLPKEAVDSPTAVERFHQEVKAAAKLEHSNIVTAFDADESNGTHFLVMQFVDGQDLASLVRSRGPMSIAKAVDYVVQAAKGLEYAHKKGVVHRDIKPANLLLDQEGTVKILDMGLAKLEMANGGNGSAVTQAQLTQDGTVMGTVDFMSPEQAMDTRTADARSDIYSLGCTLFYLLTGKPVFEGPTLLAKMMAHKESDIPVLDEERDGTPTELSAVHEKMMAKEPGDRYQTATELLETLENVADGLEDDEAAMDTIPLQETAFDLQSKETSSASLDQTVDLQPDAKPVEPAIPAPAAGWSRMIGGGVAVLALAVFGWLYFAGIIFKVETPDGIIQIESNVADFEVFVDEHKVVAITDPNDQKKIRVEVKPGAKTLTVSKDGFEAEVAKFRLKTVKGPIKVTFVVKEQIPATAGGDLDREVAEWVLSVGGLVTVALETKGDVSVSKPDHLPDEAFIVRLISLYGEPAKPLPSEQFTKLLHLKHLSYLNLGHNPNVSDATLKTIQSHASTTTVTDKWLTQLLLDSTKVTDSGLKHLSTLPNVTQVSLSYVKITDAGLKHLTTMPKLVSLNLGGTLVADAEIGLFANRPLTSLSLSGSRITDATLECVSKWPDLRGLRVTSTQVTDDGIQNLHDVTTLEELKIGHTRITDAGIAHLRNLKNLQILCIDRLEVTDAGLGHLEGLKNLRNLNLASTNVSNDAVDVLKSLTHLEELDLTGTKITAEGIEAIRKALPNCKVVWEGEGGPESK